MDQELGFIQRHLRSGGIAVDVGSNIGFYSLALSGIVGEKGRVVCFEPGPVSFALLSRNVYANVIKGNISNNLELVNKAVSDSSGKKNLFLCPTGESDNQIHDGDTYYFSGDPEEIRIAWEVDTTSLDSHFDDDEIRRISYIKIDTQGHEYYVLKGMAKIFSINNSVTLTVEYAPYLKAWEQFTPLDYFNLIKSYNLRVYDLKFPDKEVDFSYLITEYGHLDNRNMTTLILKH